MKRVNGYVSISIAVGMWLIKAGYVTASSTGVATESLEKDNSLGILHQNSFAERKGFAKIFSKKRRVFLGTIWFENSLRGAEEDHWVFEVFGRDNLDDMTLLANGIAEEFNVKIRVELVKNESEFESFESDCAV